MSAASCRRPAKARTGNFTLLPTGPPQKFRFPAVKGLRVHAAGKKVTCLHMIYSPTCDLLSPCASVIPSAFPRDKATSIFRRHFLFYLNHILPTCVGRLICRPHRSCWLANSPSASPSGVNPFYSDRDIAYVAYETAQRVLQHSVPLETRSRFQLLYPR
jgi:hypothetical protein